MIALIPIRGKMSAIQSPLAACFYRKLCMSLQRQNPPRLEHSTERTPPEISEDVLKSARMQNVIQKVSRQLGKPVEEVVKEAQEILREMAHARFVLFYVALCTHGALRFRNWQISLSRTRASEGVSERASE